MTGSTGTDFWNCHFRCKKTPCSAIFPMFHCRKKHVVFFRRFFHPGEVDPGSFYPRQCRTRNKEMRRSWHVERAWLEKRRGEDLFTVVLPLLETISKSTWKCSLPKKKGSSSNHPFSGAKMLVLGRVGGFMSKMCYFCPYLGRWSNLTDIA